MSLQLVNANAVIVARHFNPSVVSQIWLVDNGLAARDDFRPGCVFTDMLAHVVCREFVLFVSPEQLQFTPLGESDQHQDLTMRTLGRLVQALPHTPYTAVGLNFTWHFRPERVAVGEFTRGLFFDAGRPLSRAFDAVDARFGGYLSRDALGCRLKLDVKPIKVQATADDELVQFSFNFHLDLDRERDCVEQITALLARWNEAQELSERTMRLVREEAP